MLPTLQCKLCVQVRQGQDAGIAECLGCTKPRYCLVLFNTHSAVFTIKEFSSKAHLETAYASAFQAVLNADARCADVIILCVQGQSPAECPDAATCDVTCITCAKCLAWSA